MKLYVKVIEKGSKADEYVVQNLTWSGAYLKITLPYSLIKKVMKLVLLTETRPEVYVATMTAVLSGSYDSLGGTLNHLKCLKLKYHPGNNASYLFSEILEYTERLESSGAFNPNHLGYVTRIVENNCDPRFHLWETQRYNYVK